MGDVLVLVHSPLVGPSTWWPVAERLRERGYGVVVPPIADAITGSPPYWPGIAETVRGAVPEAGDLVLVAHSNAGVLLPPIAAAVDGRVRTCVFADATLPAEAAETRMVGEEQLGFLRDLAGDDGLLPPWTAWFSEEAVAPLFPDPVTRRQVEAEQPRLPLDYFEQRVPSELSGVPCGYLLFSPPYQEVAREATARGWPIREEPGAHLHQIVDYDGVTAAILDLLRDLE